MFLFPHKKNSFLSEVKFLNVVLENDFFFSGVVLLCVLISSTVLLYVYILFIYIYTIYIILYTIYAIYTSYLLVLQALLNRRDQLQAEAEAEAPAAECGS